MQHQFKLYHTTPDRMISVFAHWQPIHHTSRHIALISKKSSF